MWHTTILRTSLVWRHADEAYCLPATPPPLSRARCLRSNAARNPNQKCITYIQTSSRLLVAAQMCRSLTELDATGNRLTDMAGLSTHIQLKVVRLGSNKIQAVEGIENLKNLQVGGSEELSSLTLVSALSVSRSPSQRHCPPR